MDPLLNCQLNKLCFDINWDIIIGCHLHLSEAVLSRFCSNALKILSLSSFFTADLLASCFSFSACAASSAFLAFINAGKSIMDCKRYWDISGSFLGGGLKIK